MICTPRLTSLKTTRQTAAPKRIEPSEYIRPAKSDASLCPFQFRSVKEWTSFNSVINTNLAKLAQLDFRTNVSKTVDDFTQSVEPLLRGNSMDVRFHTPGPDCPVLGKPDSVLCKLVNNEVEPILAGLFLSRQVDATPSLWSKRSPVDFCSARSVGATLPGALAHTTSSFSNSEVFDQGDELALMTCTPLRMLSNIMLLNGLKYAFLVSEAFGRFVQVRGNNKDGFDLLISKPYFLHESRRALIALCMESYWGEPRWVENPCWKIIPQVVEEPCLNPLSKFEVGTVSKVKWWVANRVARQSYTLCFASNDVSSHIGSMHSLGFYLKKGVNMLNGSNSRWVSILLAPLSDSKLRNIASMLQFLNGRGSDHVPPFIVFAEVLGYHALVVEHLGQVLTSSGLKLAGVIDQMHAALSELHAIGVMMGRIDLSGFFITPTSDETARSKIKIIGLSEARLFRRVPTVARATEHKKLDALVARSLA